MTYPSAQELLDALTVLIAEGEAVGLEGAYLQEEPGRGYYQRGNAASTGTGNRAAQYVITIEATAGPDGTVCDGDDRCGKIFDVKEEDGFDAYIAHLERDHNYSPAELADILNSLV